jgi:hypothetical protein
VFSIKTKGRFDDVGEETPNGSIDYAYHGYNYLISNGGTDFNVRTYDDEPRTAAVISPANARTLPEAPKLVSFLVLTLGVTKVKFYCGGTGSYRDVDLTTLKFKNVDGAT